MSEQWKPVLGYEGLYEVSDQGRVRTQRPRGNRAGARGGSQPQSSDGVLRLTKSTDGYPQCVLYDAQGRRATKRMHLLVMAAFHGPRPAGAVAGHLNAKRDDNRAANLAWITHRDNMAQRERDGNTARGSGHGRAKLGDDDVRAIRAAHRKVTQRELAKQYGVSKQLIGFIHQRRLWRHI